MDQQHDSKGHVSPPSGVGDVRSRAIAPRGDLAAAIGRLIAELGDEKLGRQCHHDACPEVQYRRGWDHATDRIRARLTVALAEHRLDVALAELRACDVDAITFGHAGEGG